MEWKGLPSSRLKAICDAIPYHQGAREMAVELKRLGLKLGIVSTGLTLLAERVVAELGFDFHAANKLVEDEGRMTGELVITVAHGAKAGVLHAFSHRESIPAEFIAGVGDSEGDIALLQAAGLGIAFNPAGEEIARIADVVVPDLDLRAIPGLLTG
jgi:phosphoserine phosphatase